MINQNYGVQLNVNQIPISLQLKKLIKKNILQKENIFNVGDNYELIVISDIKNRKRIQS